MSDANETNPPDQLYRLSVLEYDRIMRAGVIGNDEKVELIDGFIVHKEPRDRAHPLAAKQAMLALLRVLPSGWHVASEKPIVVSKQSKPEPDLAVVKGQARDYLERDIVAADVSLVIKIAQTRVEVDRTMMAAIYAASGVPAYWILNVAGEQIEVYSQPAGGRYEARAEFRFGQEVSLVVEGTCAGTIPVVDVLP